MSLARNLTTNPFGDINIDGEGVPVFNPNVPTIQDFIYRHEGLQRAIYNHQLVIEAFGAGTRANYILKKRNHLNGIAVNLRDIMRMELKRYLEAGMSQDMARKQSMKFVREYKKKALELHEKQFPTNFDYSSIMNMLKVKKEGVVHEN